jgi:hypothetical protein
METFMPFNHQIAMYVQYRFLGLFETDQTQITVF